MVDKPDCDGWWWVESPKISACVWVGGNVGHVHIGAQRMCGTPTSVLMDAFEANYGVAQWKKIPCDFHKPSETDLSRLVNIAHALVSVPSSLSSLIKQIDQSSAHMSRWCHILEATFWTWPNDDAKTKRDVIVKKAKELMATNDPDSWYVGNAVRLALGMEFDSLTS